MKPNAVHLHIKKLVLDEPMPDGMSPDVLASAIRSQLQSGQTQSGPLARAVAGGIGERLGAMNINNGAKQSGGRHD